VLQAKGQGRARENCREAAARACIQTIGVIAGGVIESITGGAVCTGKIGVCYFCK